MKNIIAAEELFIQIDHQNVRSNEFMLIETGRIH